MKFFVSIITLFLIAFSVDAQKDSIPKNYKVINEVLGDLDNDNIEEKVVVYNMTSNDERDGVDREIIIFKKENQNWIIWYRSTKAIGNSTDGGMMGDPFGKIEIKKGILIINQDGGSSWKWWHSDKYRFQNGDFELIGYSSNYGKLCEYWENFDYNLFTGKIIFKKEYERCADEGSGDQIIYKRENENFTYKLNDKITLKNRRDKEIKIISPKYKHEIYF